MVKYLSTARQFIQRVRNLNSIQRPVIYPKQVLLFNTIHPYLLNYWKLVDTELKIQTKGELHVILFFPKRDNLED